MLLWFLFDDVRLGEARSQLINSTANIVYVSAVTGFKITNKIRIGKLQEAKAFVADLEQVCVRHSFKLMPLSFNHCYLAGSIQSPHRDPFDRMLAAQSIIEAMPIITINTQIRDLGAEVVW